MRRAGSRIDQLYRKFIWHMQKSGQATLMRELFEQVENHYVNSYLLRLNDAWQTHVDAARTWVAAPVLCAARLLTASMSASSGGAIRSICVIISDALRYEIGEELLTTHPQPRPLRGRNRPDVRLPAELYPARHGLAPAQQDDADRRQRGGTGLGRRAELARARKPQEIPRHWTSRRSGRRHEDGRVHGPEPRGFAALC